MSFLILRNIKLFKSHLARVKIFIFTYYNFLFDTIKVIMVNQKDHFSELALDKNAYDE